ncbi:Hpt domain-containing protein [Dolichospermum sp. UHCC 0259]|uniref:Hpt domain-containing protein n=1 Tax=Dolichospermum sp. UHCC 0259 TaxID=2590010 RepID=UPI001444D689|nr:Hpt domain-containing protein [Dolichospermum sp. UHCC 0259]MTJ49801.1 Hpt domain-containing protein [Dolichospermum sp. UHCC 0259]
MSSIDTQVLESLLDMLEGDQEVFAEIINCYLMESPKIIAAIQTSASQGDADNLGKTAHSLKSSSASLGAMNVHQLCLELELKGKKGNLTESDWAESLELISQLINEYAQVEIALNKIL